MLQLLYAGSSGALELRIVLPILLLLSATATVTATAPAVRCNVVDELPIRRLLPPAGTRLLQLLYAGSSGALELR